MSLGADSENWRAISGYPAFQVSDLGRVRRTDDWIILSPSTNKSGYRQIYLSHNKKGRTYLVHRLVASEFIENPAGKPCVDHVDRCNTNNFASNLRWSTHSENLANRAKQQRNTTSEFIGVYWNKRLSKWHARININKRKKHLGYFSNEVDAARAFNNAAIQYHGEFAVLNPIPDDDDNTDSQDDDNPELTTPTSEYDEYTAESGEVEEDVD
jgi:hypothetical protein